MCQSELGVNMKEVSVNDLHQLREKHEDFILLDVREPFEFDACNLGGTLIPLGQLPTRLSELNKDKKIIVHCKLGGRSQRAVEYLMEQGFTDVSNLTGGIFAWIDKIDPTLKKY